MSVCSPSDPLLSGTKNVVMFLQFSSISCSVNELYLQFNFGHVDSPKVEAIMTAETDAKKTNSKTETQQRSGLPGQCQTVNLKCQTATALLLC